jgi:electron transport complex protein RnfC
MAQAFFGGVHPNDMKAATNEKAIEQLQAPAQVVIPMSMHFGAPCTPTVSKGDYVKLGQKIGEFKGLGAPIHASVSGTVAAVEPRPYSMGGKVMSVVIDNDFKDDLSEEVHAPADPDALSVEEMVEMVKQAGIVGMGGATFPTHTKISSGIGKVDTVIINGAECEPYITSDTRTMLDRSDELMEGARLVQHFLQVRRVIFAIEDNKPRCIQLYRKLTKDEDGMEVCALKSLYPQGGEKVLIYNTIGEIVPEGKLPLDVGAIVLNCTTLANIARYCRTGMPLVEKCITVDGSAVAKPKNVIVPIGMKLADVFEQAGGFCTEPKKVLYGGPMMGIAVPDLEQPVLKNTNAVLAMSEADAVLPEPSACIRCGRCIRHCPLRLMPSHIVAAYEAGNMERLAELKVNLCMECGCCSFGCPAHRPLVQTNKLAKAKLAAWRKAQSEKLDAKKEAVK